MNSARPANATALPDGSAFLVRPDGYLMGRWKAASAADIAAALKPFQQQLAAGAAHAS
jgi:3-(3-hydroxy-phenyl)propionate hydroxylase